MQNSIVNHYISNSQLREFPGGPGVRTWCFHCRGPVSIPVSWSGNQDPAAARCGQKNQKPKTKKTSQLQQLSAHGQFCFISLRLLSSLILF